MSGVALDAVAAHSQTRGNTRNVLTWLARYVDHRSALATTELGELARATGLSERQVYRELRRLKSCGEITQISGGRGRGRRLVFRVHPDRPSQLALDLPAGLKTDNAVSLQASPVSLGCAAKTDTQVTKTDTTRARVKSSLNPLNNNPRTPLERGTTSNNRRRRRNRGPLSPPMPPAPCPVPIGDAAAIEHPAWRALAADVEQLPSRAQIHLASMHPHAATDSGLIVGVTPRLARAVMWRFGEWLNDTAGMTVMVVPCDGHRDDRSVV